MDGERPPETPSPALERPLIFIRDEVEGVLLFLSRAAGGASLLTEEYCEAWLSGSEHLASRMPEGDWHRYSSAVDRSRETGELSCIEFALHGLGETTRHYRHAVEYQRGDTDAG